MTDSARSPLNNILAGRGVQYKGYCFLVCVSLHSLLIAILFHSLPFVLCSVPVLPLPPISFTPLLARGCPCSVSYSLSSLRFLCLSPCMIHLSCPAAILVPYLTMYAMYVPCAFL